MHALAHIEFNAINLALDAVHRFRAMPHEYYHDWLRVADEEIGHVAIGSRWFYHLCEQRILEPVSTFTRLFKNHFPKGLHGPFNVNAREKAGFSEAEIEILAAGL